MSIGFTMSELSWWGWVLVVVSAVVVGMSKAGFAGVALIAVWLMAEVFPARESTGMLLLLLIAADFMAAGFFRQHARWGLIWRLLPPALIGIIVGALLMDRIRGEQFRVLMGYMVLLMIGMQVARRRLPGLFEGIPHTKWFAWLMGGLMGVSTMLANAAGPVAILYLLALDLGKMSFAGTLAWFFLIVNLSKVPFSLHLGLINPPFLKLALVMSPVVFLGVLIGRRLLAVVGGRAYEWILVIFAGAAAIRLIAG